MIFRYVAHSAEPSIEERGCPQLPLCAFWLAAAMVAAMEPARAVDQRAIFACTTITDDRRRLQCFDMAVAHAAKSERSSNITITKLSRFELASGVDAAVPPLVAAPILEAPMSEAPGPRMRFAVGYGFGVGDHTGSFRVLSGAINLQSAVGNSGDLVSGQLWIDRWLGENWTVGLEYLAIRNEGKATLTLPRGLSILTDPVNGGARVKLRADLGFLNVAYRPAAGWVHPFIGGGFGVGYGHGSAWYDLENAFIGSFAGVAAVGKPIAGIQGFAGVEFDLPYNAYLAVMPRVVILDGHPIGVEQRYLDFGVTGLMGWRF
jgi:hypothetical protein